VRNQQKWLDLEGHLRGAFGTDVDESLLVIWPKMDREFFRLPDGCRASQMHHEVNEGEFAEIHLAAVTDEVLWQVIRELNPWREILLSDSIHLP